MQLNTKNIFAASLLIIVLSFAYYFVIFLPEKQRTEQEIELKKIEAEKAQSDAELRYKLLQEQDRKSNLESCLKNAHDNYKSTWDLNCPKFGINIKEDSSCSLPAYLFDTIEKGYKEDQELCIKRYK